MKNVITMTSNDFFLNISYQNYNFKNIKFKDVYNLNTFEILNYDMILVYIEDLEKVSNKVTYLEEVFFSILEFKKTKYTSKIPIMIIFNKANTIPYKHFYKEGVNDIVSTNIDKEILFLKIDNFINLYKEYKDKNKELYQKYLTKIQMKNLSKYNGNFKREIKKKQYLGFIITEFDNIKNISELYGEDKKDELFDYLSNRITDTFRDDDYILTWNYQQFLIISSIHRKDELEMLAKRVIKNVLMLDLKEPLNIDTRISLCRGLSVKDLENDLDKNRFFKYFIRDAEKALKKAQLEGQRQYKFYIRKKD